MPEPGRLRISEILDELGGDALTKDSPGDDLLDALSRIRARLLEAGVDMVFVDALKAEIKKRVGRGRARLVERAFDLEDKLPRGEVGKWREPAEIVDTVRDGLETRYVIAVGNEIRIVEEWNGLKPWTLDRLPYAPIPSVKQVKAALDTKRGPQVYLLARRFMRSAVLPTPRWDWALLLSVWCHGTYLMDWFRHWPELYLPGPPARGKTRVGALAIYAARRGYVTPVPRPATLIRDRSYHRAGLLYDTEDLPHVMMTKDEISDLLLSSYARDGQVRLVVRPEAPPERQTETFYAYGPTVIATNKAVKPESPLLSRAITVMLPEATHDEIRRLPPVPEANDLMGVRARLIAWAAEVRSQGSGALPLVTDADLGELRSRMRDIAIPFLAVAKLIVPKYLEPIRQLLAGVEREQRAETARTWEGRVAIALWTARQEGLVFSGRVSVEVLVEIVNRHVELPEKLTPNQVGIARSALGLRGHKASQRYVVWPGDAEAEALYRRYADPEI